MLSRFAVLVLAIAATTDAWCDGGQPAKAKVFDAKTDYSKLSLDDLIVALDAGGNNKDALAEVLRRGPDALKAAMPVVRDWKYGRSNEIRMWSLLLINREILDRPEKLLADFRVAAKPGPWMYPPWLGEPVAERSLASAVDPYLAPPLLKALRGDNPIDRKAAVEMLATLRFFGVASLIKEVGKLAVKASGDRRNDFLELLAKLPVGAVEVYAGFLVSEDPELATAALKGLNEIRPFPRADYPAGAAALKPLFRHKDEKVRVVVLQAAFLIGDRSAALPEILKHPWPRQPSSKSGAESPWPILPKGVEDRFKSAGTDEINRNAAAIKAAILTGDTTSEFNAIYALSLAEEWGLPIWRELKDAKDDTIQLLAKRNLEKVVRRDLPKPFLEVPAEEQKKRFREWLDKPNHFHPGSPSPSDITVEMIVDAIPIIAAKIDKAQPDDRGLREWAVMLLRAGPKGHAVLKPLLESRDSKAFAVFDAWEYREIEAVPSLLPAARKCLTAPELKLRLGAALVFVRDESAEAEVVKTLKETLELIGKPAELARTLGDDPKYADDLVEHMRPKLLFALARADVAGRQSHLANLLELLRKSIDPTDDHGARDIDRSWMELGPIGKGVSPDLVKLMTQCKDPNARALVARVLRAVDAEAAKKAGVR
jgi:hypothetical protein